MNINSKMKKAIDFYAWAFLLCLPFTLFSQTTKSGSALAMEFLKTNELAICNAALKYQANPNEVIGIGYPELLKGFEAGLKDTKKTTSLYINLGSREADIKMGEFQMRTSMVEQIEKIVSKFPTNFGKFQNLFTYSSNDERTIRTERLDRMNDINWQLSYLFAFHTIADSCFFGEKFNGIEDKTAFYSIAYKLGFDSRLNEIKDCYASFKSTELDKRAEACRKNAEIATQFLINSTPLFDCAEEIVDY